MIQIKNVTKKVSNKVILDDINLTVEKGSLVVLIGPSGCGKTTTLKLINKLIKPTSGEIYIEDKPISKENTIELRRKLGYVIQNTGLFPHLTIQENIELIPKIKKEQSVEQIEENTANLLKMVDLDYDYYKDKYPSQLSGGQQQRIGVARALATGADIILMDEPFSALDPITRASIQDQLVTLQNELKKTIIFVTHDMDEALKVADKICIMNNGKIVQYDTPENILRNPKDDYIKEFIGMDRLWNNPEFIKARDIMIENPISVTSTRTIIQGIEIMRTNKVDSLLVVDKDQKLNGIVTLKGIKLNPNKSEPLQSIMATDLVHVEENDNLIDILSVMDEHEVGYIPVVSNKERLVGLITRSSLITALSGQFLEEEVSILG